MRMRARVVLVCAWLSIGVEVTAQSAPVVTNVQARQLPGSGGVLVTYDLADSDSYTVSVTLRVSDNGGGSFEVPAFHCSGDVFSSVRPGPGRVLLWDAATDWPGQAGDNWRVEVVARDGTVVDVLPGGVPVEFAVIRPGTFTMGSSWGYSDERPPHQVTLTRPYCLGVYELTQSQWRSVMSAPPWVGKDLAKDGPFYPAAYISSDDLELFLARLNGAAQQSETGKGGAPAGAQLVADLVELLPGGASMGFVWIEPGSFTMGSPASELGGVRTKARRTTSPSLKASTWLSSNSPRRSGRA